FYGRLNANRVMGANSIAIQIVVVRIVAIGDIADNRAGHAVCIIQEFAHTIENRIHTEFIEGFGYSSSSGVNTGDLRTQISLQRIGNAAVCPKKLENAVLWLSLVVQLHRRN